MDILSRIYMYILNKVSPHLHQQSDHFTPMPGIVGMCWSFQSSDRNLPQYMDEDGELRLDVGCLSVDDCRVRWLGRDGVENLSQVS